MPSPNATPTPITPPRVPLIDSRTGLIDRAWYMFFLSLMNAAMLVYEGDVGPNSESLLASYDAALQSLAQNVNTQPLPVDLSAELTKQIEAAGLTDYATNLLSQVAEMQKQLEALNLLPQPTQGALTNGTSILYGDGSGGFSNVSTGSGVSFVAGVLSATGSGGTITSVTATAPIASSGGFTPNISINAAYGDTINPYATKTANYVLAGPTSGAATAPTFRALVAGDIPSLPYGTVTSVTGISPVVSSGGTTPAISMPAATTSVSGYLTSTDWNTFNGKGSGTVTSVAISGGTTGLTTSGGPISTSGTITFAGTLAVANGGTGVATLTGLAKGNGTSAFTAATAGTDYVVPGGALGTPSSGTVTNLTGTANITATGGASGAIAATTLSASSTVSGAGFTTYLASPPSIGGTAAAAVSATALSYTTTLTGGTGIVNLGSGQFYKDGSGNVGIGTTTPGTTIDVRTSAATVGNFQSSATNGGYITLNNGSTLTYIGAQKAILATGNSTDFAIVGTGANNFVLGTASTERMRIDANGNVGIGGTANASAILDAQSTTKGVRMPNMTTTQKNAIATPAAGLMIFDTTLAKLCVYSGSAWQTITST